MISKIKYCSIFLVIILISCIPSFAVENNTISMYNDEVFDLVKTSNGIDYNVIYKWDNPARIYTLSASKEQIARPGRLLCTLRFIHENKNIARRSDAHVDSLISCKIVKVSISVGQKVSKGDILFILRPVFMHHDSLTKTQNTKLNLKSLVMQLWRSTGIYSIIYQTNNDWTLGIGRLFMIIVGLILLFLAISKGFEPLLLIPIGFGAILSNIPLADLAGPDGFLGMVYSVGIETGIFPLIIFMGVGAMTDFSPLIANPKTALLGAAAQVGIFAALLGALSLSAFGINFSLHEAASIGIIGGADGPTAIFLAGKLAPNLLGAIAVSAYSYMALVPLILPPIMRFMTTPEERKIRMVQLRPVSRLEKIFFPISITLLCALLLPDASALIGMLMFGNLLRESGVALRLSNTVQNALMNTVTIFLGLAVGSKLSAEKFLNFQTIGILLMGLVAFCVGTACGIALAKLMNKITGGKINPLIGAAGVSAVPMAARVVNLVGTEEDPQNFLLMHAMGPNVAGVIGSAVAAGVLLNALRIIG